MTVFVSVYNTPPGLIYEKMVIYVIYEQMMYTIYEHVIMCIIYRI